MDCAICNKPVGERTRNVFHLVTDKILGYSLTRWEHFDCNQKEDKNPTPRPGHPKGLPTIAKRALADAFQEVREGKTSKESRITMKETIKVRAVDKRISITIEATIESEGEAVEGISYTKRILMRELLIALSHLPGSDFGFDNVTVES